LLSAPAICSELLPASRINGQLLGRRVRLENGATPVRWHSSTSRAKDHVNQRQSFVEFGRQVKDSVSQGRALRLNGLVVSDMRSVTYSLVGGTAFGSHPRLRKINLKS
jgi:hypothetical protein